MTFHPQNNFRGVFKFFQQKNLKLIEHMHIYLFALCLFISGSLTASSPQPILFATLQGFTPAFTYDAGQLKSGDVIKVTLTWTDDHKYSTKLYKKEDDGIIPVPLQATQISAFEKNETVTRVVNQDGKYLLEVQTTARVAIYNIQISINGVETGNQAGYGLNNNYVPTKNFTIESGCKIKFQFIGPPTIIGLLGSNEGESTLMTTHFSEFTYKFQKGGEYYVYILPDEYVQFAPVGSLLPYTLFLYTFCDDYCTSPTIPNDPSSKHCPKCGDGIFEKGEECDNKNSVGCSLNCKIDAGFKCQNKEGLSSVCSAIIQGPHCGNGVFQPLLGQICDDSNNVDGDGCNSTCQVEEGWICTDSKNCISLYK